jgi:two-component system sensor histidine kinase DesK
MAFRLLPESHLGWTPYAWLVYLSFFVVYAVWTNEPRDWLIDAPALLAFLVLYFRGFWVQGRALLLIALAIAGLGMLLGPRNPGANCFVIYSAAFMGGVGRPLAAVRWLAVILSAVAFESWLLALSPAFWAPAIVISLLVGGSNIHFEEVRRKDQALLKAHEAAEHLATIAERERIARDLHDLLGHTLSIIVLKSELAAKVGARDPQRALQEIRDVERISRQALTEVRQAVYGYRGDRLDEELRTGRTALEAAGVTLDADVTAAGLTPEQERTLALAVREAVTNVIRHSHARRCRIALAHQGEGITLTIEDDGIGGDATEGVGLSGMRARLAAIGGRLEREGRNGTRLILTLPSSSPARAMVSP